MYKAGLLELLKEVLKVSEIIKPKSIDELERLIEQGYRGDRNDIQSLLKISKTQFYDYIYKEVSKVKVNKKLRDELEGYSYIGAEKFSDEKYIEITVERIISDNKSTLFNHLKIIDYLIKNELLIFELYDLAADKYIKLNQKRIIDDNDLLFLAFSYAESRIELQKKIVKNKTDNSKTLESRFHIELKKHTHFRINICGKYLYSIIDQIRKK